jgi:hypothetical protein
MATCGLWPTRRGIVAVIVDDNGAVVGPAHLAAPTRDGIWALLAHVEAHQGLDCRFVSTDSAVAGCSAFGEIAARRGSLVLIVKRSLFESLCVLLGASRTPKKLALLLARLPLCAPLATRLMPLQLQLF